LNEIPGSFKSAQEKSDKQSLKETALPENIMNEFGLMSKNIIHRAKLLFKAYSDGMRNTFLLFNFIFILHF